MAIDTKPGITHEEAEILLKKHGPNELSQEKRKTFVQSVLHVFREPMLVLLLACAFIYLILGDLTEGVLLCLSALFMVAINLYQNKKTENALKTLKDLSAPRVLVIRSGKEIRISGKEVVPGDCVVLSEGDRVPADLQLTDSSHLTVDESLLTGESVPVHKNIEKDNLLYSGSLVVKGRGIAKVLSTGSKTEIGKIGKSLSAISQKGTKLQLEIIQLGKALFFFSVLFCVFIVIVYWQRGAHWQQAWLAGLAASISLLPEEMPVILTLFFAIGAWRISKQKVLTRQVSAIENLGATTILCVDKTGTLTKNEMHLRKLVVENEKIDLKDTEHLPEKYHRLVEYAVLSSHRDPFDPMEKAILAALDKKVSEEEHRHPDWVLLKEYPLSDQLLAMSCVWDTPKSEQHIVAVKGAAEAVFDLCHLSQDEKKKYEEQVNQLASEGLRTLCVAGATIYEGKSLPPSSHSFDFKFIGILGLEDPLREEVPSVLETFRSAGIRVIMMTGDHPETARKIGKEAGFPKEGTVITGQELDSWSEDTLKERLRDVSIFARVRHDQKLRIVEMLKSLNEVVAMTGDGVNDAPSLKNADIGIAMGKRGTDVAREAADIVLVEDDFQSIADAIRQGRRIYDNIRNAVSYVLALHIPIGGMTLIPAFLGWPLLLSPLHLVFLELFIDPSCSLALEGIAGDSLIMNRPPRRRENGILQWRFLLKSSIHGIIPLLFILAATFYGMNQGWQEGVMKGFSFLALVASIIGLLLLAIPRTQLKEKNGALWGVLLLLIVSVPAIYGIALVRNIFGFDPLSMGIALKALGVGILPTWLFGKLFSIRDS